MSKLPNTHIDIRQWPFWGEYLKSIGWNIEISEGRQIFIRRIPFFPFSVAKLQRPDNPVNIKWLDTLAKKHNALFILFEPRHDSFKEERFKKAGFQRSMMILANTSTMLIDLNRSEEKLFASFSENARRNIKKAQKDNLKVKTVFMKDDKGGYWFEQFFKLFKNLSKMKKFYIPSYEEHLKKVKSLKDNSLILFAYSDSSKDPIAAVWLGFYKGNAIYINTGIVTEGYEKLANYLLVWEAFKISKKLGMTIFDFEGVFDPRFPKDHPKWGNFTEFKQRFHGTKIDYPPPLIKIYSPVFRVIYFLGKFLNH